MKKFLLVATFIIYHFVLLAQTPSSGLIVGVNIGSSKVITEMYPDFTTVNEFNHLPGLIVEPELNKLFGKHFEIGTSFAYSNLKGETDNPQFSAEGHHPAMIDPNDPTNMNTITEPVRYNTRLMGEKFYFGYYFRSFEKINKSFMPEPFLRVGGGYFYYWSDFAYQDPALGTIFGKGVEDYTDLTTGVIFTTAGLKMYITPVLFMNVSATFNYVRYDFLDAVHNYNNEGYRDRTNPDVRGIYSDFKIGFFYQIRGKKARQGIPDKYSVDYLPFASFKK